MQAIKKDILESAGLVFFTLLSKSSEVPGLWAAQGLLGWVREAKPPLPSSLRPQLPQNCPMSDCRNLLGSSFQKGTDNIFPHDWEINTEL